MTRRALLALALFFAACKHESQLPKMFVLPQANLTSETGAPVRMSDNKGYVTVYDFIFTNCAGSCPLMTRTMQLATKKIDRDAKVRFVSISVDPARDTPAVLRDYANRVRGSENRWMFVTGTQDEITKLSVDGFKLAAGPLLHSEKFAVADKNGVVREYISSLEDEAPEHVKRTVEDLLAED